jgi:DNA replication protein DnaC
MQPQKNISKMLMEQNWTNPPNRSIGQKEPSADKSKQGFYQDEKSFFQHCVPERFKHCELENLLDISPEIIMYGYKWAVNPESIFIHGNPGNGKTSYIFALLREMFRRCPKKLWPKFYSSPELDAKLLEAVKADDGDAYLLKFLSTEDILFIDDFGRENNSPRIKRQYFEIINNRYAGNKVTILTSNFDINQIGNSLGDALASRLQEWQEIIFSKPDLRKKKFLEG